MSSERPGTGLKESRGRLYVHLDLSSGVAGDMLLGALLDLGVDRRAVDDALARLGLPETVISTRTTRRGGLRAVELEVADQPGSEVARLSGYADGERLIGESSLDEAIKKRSMGAIRRLAEAEAEVHGVAVDDVHFHEISGVDTIVDIVGVTAALEWLEPIEVTGSPVAVGGGRVTTAHGVLPVPAPATAQLLRGVPVFGEPGPRRELATPTGAALVKQNVARFGNLPPMVIGGVGYGAGHMELEEQPNVVRAIWGTAPGGVGADSSHPQLPEGEAGELVEIRCNLDDMSPELVANAAERVLEAGARDSWVEPVVMKKGRPGWVLAMLAGPGEVAGLVETVFAETSTFGVRYHRVSRATLRRRTVRVETRWGEIVCKEAVRAGRVIRVAPELESCRAAAERHAVALQDVYEEARHLARLSSR
jgi:uncharacterized protein (TIGR00299 family) protein